MEFNQREYHAVVLGALLHDIGTFVQRSQDNPMSKDHSRWGEEWFQNKLAEKLTSIFDENARHIIKSAISKHHENEKYISLADAISTGMDRVGIKLDDEERGDSFTDRLISIFSGVSISGRPKIEKYNKLAHLGKNQLDEVFPIDEKKCSPKEYATLLEGFETEIRTANFQDLQPGKVINFIYFLLWKYCWCIPSATLKVEPDVSLFVHLKTTAAIAGCLNLYHQENMEGSFNIESKAICLVGGDISGIQNYIFDVLTQQGKVAKRLRARSLFIQLTSEIASHKILHAFHLPLCNLITSAGGNFYILVPNLRNTNEMIENLQKEMDDWTLKELNAELSVNLAATELTGKDFVDFSKLLERLRIELSHQKYQPHKALLCHEGRWIEHEFLRPEVIEGDERACQGCHKFPKREMDETEGFCEKCFRDTRIGQVLPKVKYAAFFNDDFHEFKVFNYSFELWDDEELSAMSKESPYLILSLKNTEMRLPVIGFKFVANHIATKEDIPTAEVEENQPVTFDDIANTSMGDKLFGYVKADVDNLGRILRDGFIAKKLSVSRYTTLSRLLETFFAGHLQVKMESAHREMYTVFSGGDDFFLLGPWDKSIEFAKSIRRDFSLFCAENPDLTFSAGIILTKPHEPISYCAEMVEDKLKESKRKEDKDKITIFNQTVGWEEFEKILEEANRIIDWLKREPTVVTRAFIYNLRKYGEMAEESCIYEPSLGVKTEFLRFIPLLVDDIKRNLTKEEQKVAFNWAQDLIPTIDRPKGGYNLEFLRAIMEYVLIYTRG